MLVGFGVCRPLMLTATLVVQRHKATIGTSSSRYSGKCALITPQYTHFFKIATTPWSFFRSIDHKLFGILCRHSRARKEDGGTSSGGCADHSRKGRTEHFRRPTSRSSMHHQLPCVALWAYLGMSTFNPCVIPSIAYPKR